MSKVSWKFLRYPTGVVCGGVCGVLLGAGLIRLAYELAGIQQTDDHRTGTLVAAVVMGALGMVAGLFVVNDEGA